MFVGLRFAVLSRIGRARRQHGRSPAGRLAPSGTPPSLVAFLVVIASAVPVAVRADDPFSELAEAMVRAAEKVAEELANAPRDNPPVFNFGGGNGQPVKSVDFDTVNSPILGTAVESSMKQQMVLLEKMFDVSGAQRDAIYRRARLGVPRFAVISANAMNFNPDAAQPPDLVHWMQAWLAPVIEDQLSDDQFARWSEQRKREIEWSAEMMSATSVLSLNQTAALTPKQFTQLGNHFKAAYRKSLTRAGTIDRDVWGQDLREILTPTQMKYALNNQQARMMDAQRWMMRVSMHQMSSPTVHEEHAKRWTATEAKLRAEAITDNSVLSSKDETVSLKFGGIDYAKLPMTVGEGPPEGMPGMDFFAPVAEVAAAVEVVEMVEVVAIDDMDAGDPELQPLEVAVEEPNEWQDDDVDVAVEAELALAPPAIGVNNDQRTWDPDSCDSMLVSGASSLKQARQTLEDLLMLQIDRYQQAGAIAEKDALVLSLAGQTDVDRFFTRYRKFKEQYPADKADMNEVNQRQMKVWDLQQECTNGLHRDGSVFAKTLRRIETNGSPAMRKLAEQLESHRTLRYKQFFLFTLTASATLTDKSHAKLSDLIDQCLAVQPTVSFKSSAKAIGEMLQHDSAEALSPTEANSAEAILSQFVNFPANAMPFD